MTALFWLTSIASLVGVVLNVHRRRECFLIFAVTNSVWMVADWMHGLPSQAVLQLAYLGLSIYGLVRWRARRSSVSSGE